MYIPVEPGRLIEDALYPLFTINLKFAQSPHLGPFWVEQSNQKQSFTFFYKQVHCRQLFLHLINITVLIRAAKGHVTIAATCLLRATCGLLHSI